MQTLPNLIPENTTAKELFCLTLGIEERGETAIEALAVGLNLEDDTDWSLFGSIVSQVEAFQHKFVEAVDARIAQLLEASGLTLEEALN